MLFTEIKQFFNRSKIGLILIQNLAEQNAWSLKSSILRGFASSIA